MSLNPEEMSGSSLTNEDLEGSKGEERSGDVENMDHNDVTNSNSQNNGDSKEENKNSDQSISQTIWRTEEDVGITEYLGTHKGFSAIIKQRYSDFHVNEVNAQGEVVHLTDESTPDPPQEKQKEEKVSEGAPACIPEEKIAEINHMVEEMNISPTKDNVMADEEKKAKKKLKEVLIKVDGLEKQERTSIHLYIKTNYKKITSSTREINGEKFILVKTGASADDRWDKKTWPKSQRYTYFVLYKENLDTMDAISQIAFKLRMKPSMFSYAGTKDKRGKTSQLVSVPELPPHRLYSVTQYNWSLMVGNFSFHHKPLKLGQLCGNRFKLVLRDISVSDEVVNNAVENLKSHGFINYYGMQRFGTTHISTNSIGKALLQGNWSEAVNLILSPRTQSKSHEYSMSNVLQGYHKDGNATEALHKLYDCYKGSSIEAQLLRGISECDKNDFVGALGRLPRNMRSLYLHAYQSFIWNSVASRRIKEFGFRVLPGDLVRQRSSASAKEMLPEDESEAIDAEDGTLVEEVPQEETAIDDLEHNKKNADIHVLTAEEAKTTDITQILLPLPGHDILLPENEMKNWYLEMLEKDGLSLEKLKHKVKDYSVSGVYRRMLVRPSDVHHFITYYNDLNSLVQSDKEKLKGEDVEKNKLEGFPGLAEGNPIKPMDEDGPLTSIKPVDTILDTETKELDPSSDQKENVDRVNNDDNKEGSEEGHGGVKDNTKGRMKALVLELTLPASVYATMALRELLKIDTSTQFINKPDPANAGISSGRGRGNSDNRRGGFGDRRGGFGDRRGGFGDRRGGFGDRRGGSGDRRGGFRGSRGGFGDKRRGNFGGPRGSFGEKRRGSDGGSRSSFGEERKRGRF